LVRTDPSHRFCSESKSVDREKGCESDRKLRPHRSSRTICTWVSPLVRKVLIRILYPADGTFWGFSGEQCPIANANFCDFQRQQLLRPDGRSNKRQRVSGDQDMDNAWNEHDGGHPIWEELLPTRGRETRQNGGGSVMTDRLANPPPLGH